MITQQQMNEIIWRKNIQLELPQIKRAIRIKNGLIWNYEYDEQGKLIGWFGKKIRSDKEVNKDRMV